MKENPFLEGSIFRRPLTHWIPAKELRIGDYIEGDGEVIAIKSGSALLVATLKDRPTRVFGVNEQVEVRLEDDGR
jgi:hypothetical protein